MRNYGIGQKRNIAQNEWWVDAMLIWLLGAVLQRE